MPIAIWIVRFGTAGVIFFALKAAWHWHSSTEILTRADIAGLLDGRSAMSCAAESVLEQAEQNAKGSMAAALACLLVAIVSIVSYF
ncbi:hypothetical protein AB4Y96_08225 [Phyllobacterium sp. TAF24]|uniref:hypothetical protein n=1 Tax=Phyllobacterium sp. TAF24 TaxID=3233068 RepID=UPI001113AE6D